MNATVMCEKCGKPLGVFDGNICADCSKIEQIRSEIEGDMLFTKKITATIRTRDSLWVYSIRWILLTNTDRSVGYEKCSSKRNDM